jgi:hypothetical protein
LTALLAVAVAGCSDAEKATDALRAEGFTNIRTTGWDAWGCGKSDDTCTGFEADRTDIAPLAGFHVTGAVGCGWGPFAKGCTVRIETTGGAR